MALFDSAELLTTIKNRGMVAANPGGWTDAELLKAASDEILNWHLPLLVRAKGEYLVKDHFVSAIAGAAAFPAAAVDLPYRAAAVRVVKYLTHLDTDIDAFVAENAQEAPLEELTPAKQASLSMQRDVRGTPQYYAFREGRIELWPAPDVSGVVWVKYHIRPSRLVVASDCRQISGIAENTPSPGQITLSFATAAPAALAGPSGTEYDLVAFRNPFTIRAFDVESAATVTAGVSTSLVIDKESLYLSDALKGSSLQLQQGDWICPAEKTAVPNIPAELHTPAALRAAAAACGARNQALKESLIGEAYAKELSLLGGILAPRNKGGVKRLVNRRW